MRIATLTGGGDVPGLNPCLKALVQQADARGWNVLGFRNGWAGPLKYDLDRPMTEQANRVVALDRLSVRTIDREGGTFLHTSRTNPSKVKPAQLPTHLKALASGDKPVDCTAHVLRVIEKLQIDALVPIGGDDTLSYGARLAKEGVPVISIPKTMDNDVHGTDYCLGFSTAVSRSVEMIDALRTPTGSHERIAVIELFGRNSGETALIAGAIAGVDRTLISEVPFDIERLAKLILQDRAANPANYAMVAVSEGAAMAGRGVIESGEADAFGHRKLGGIGQITGEALKKLTGVDIVSQNLGYLMRAGAPDALDRMVAANYAGLAIEELAAGRFGQMVALRNGVYQTVSATMCIEGKRHVDVDELYDREAYRLRVRQFRAKPMLLY